MFPPVRLVASLFFLIAGRTSGGKRSRGDVFVNELEYILISDRFVASFADDGRAYVRGHTEIWLG